MGADISTVLNFEGRHLTFLELGEDLLVKANDLAAPMAVKASAIEDKALAWLAGEEAECHGRR